jgi:pyruvate-ferredoxin/flavodoxin oxidoreductase
MDKGLEHQKLAVESGYWPLLRFDPSRPARGEPALILDSKPPQGTAAYEKLISLEGRFKMLADAQPDEAKRLLALAEGDIRRSWRALEAIAEETKP